MNPSTVVASGDFSGALFRDSAFGPASRSASQADASRNTQRVGSTEKADFVSDELKANARRSADADAVLSDFQLFESGRSYDDVQRLLEALHNPRNLAKLEAVYGPRLDLEQQIYRWFQAARVFEAYFPELRSVEKSFFRCGGRLEFFGNHTDHQGGDAVTASTTLDVLALAAPSGDNRIEIFSRKYGTFGIDLPRPGERLPKMDGIESNLAGLVNGMLDMGYRVGGFRAVMLSDIPGGSGISSSAAIHMALGELFSSFFNQGNIPLGDQARISQRYIEGEQWGKKSGLLDQLGCGHGGVMRINFRDPSKPAIEPVRFEALQRAGYGMALISTGTTHAGDSAGYNQIPEAMSAAARLLGKERLSDLTKQDFEGRTGELARALASQGKDGHGIDWSPLNMAIHYFEEQDRVVRGTQALSRAFSDPRHLAELFNVVSESGTSSRTRLRYTESPGDQIGMVLDQIKGYRLQQSALGAERLMGGGRGGAILSVLPADKIAGLAEHLKPLRALGIKVMPVEISAYGAVNLSELLA